MEVHHHAHHEHGKRNWKSYFWEFLMLFLAVFCGFLAEYQLEHVIEQQREEQYILSMVEDLQKDISHIDRITPELVATIHNIDTVLNRSGDLKSNNIDLTYAKHLVSVVGFPDFVYTDKTIQQLKNGGYMRLIRQQKVADEISRYDATVRGALINQGVMNDNIVVLFISKLKYTIDYGLLTKIVKGNYDKGKETQLLKQLLLVDNEVEITRLLNEFEFYQRSLLIHKQYIDIIKQKAQALLVVIKSEYELE